MDKAASSANVLVWFGPQYSSVESQGLGKTNGSKMWILQFERTDSWCMWCGSCRFTYLSLQAFPWLDSATHSALRAAYDGRKSVWRRKEASKAFPCWPVHGWFASIFAWEVQICSEVFFWMRRRTCSPPLNDVTIFFYNPNLSPTSLVFRSCPEPRLCRKEGSLFFFVKWRIKWDSQHHPAKYHQYLLKITPWKSPNWLMLNKWSQICASDLFTLG